MPHNRIRRYLRHGTLPQLAVFDASARLGSFTRAAESLHMAQPTVSAQIRKLTDTVGLPLFEQIGRNVYLTEAGRRAHAHCLRVLAALSDLDDELAALRGLDRGCVRVAASTTCGALLQRAVAAFAARYPGLDQALARRNRTQLIERLTANEDDLYVFATPPVDRDVVRQAILAQPLVVVARADHPLAGARAIACARLAAESFVLREQGSGTRMAAEQAFARAGFAPRVRLELESDAAIRQAIAAGLGVSILARHACDDDRGPPGLVELDVAGFPLARTLAFVYPVGRELSPPAKAFVDFVRTQAPALAFPASCPVRAAGAA